jgi:hypothetical protein
MAQKGIEIPPYSDIQEAEDTPIEDTCKLGVDNVQYAFEILCGGPLLSAECVDLGACGFTFKNLELIYNKEGCTLLLAQCQEDREQA